MEPGSRPAIAECDERGGGRWHAGRDGNGARRRSRSRGTRILCQSSAALAGEELWRHRIADLCSAGEFGMTLSAEFTKRTKQPVKGGKMKFWTSRTQISRTERN